MKKELQELKPAVLLAASTAPEHVQRCLAKSWLLKKIHEHRPDFMLAYSENTLIALTSDLCVWEDFCTYRNHRLIPATLVGLRDFLTQQVEKGRKLATIQRYLSSLSVLHQVAEVEFVMSSMAGKTMWRALRLQNRDALIKMQRQARGISKKDMQAMVAQCDLNTLQGARDALLVQVGFETMCRRSELVSLMLENVSSDEPVTVSLKRSKTDKQGAGVDIALSRKAVSLLENWKRLTGLQKGPMFRSLSTKSRRMLETPLPAPMVNRIYQALAAKAGLKVAGISGHSTRVGAAQTLALSGATLPGIMVAGRWTTPTMAARYTSRIEAGKTAMAELMRDDEP